MCLRPLSHGMVGRVEGARNWILRLLEATVLPKVSCSRSDCSEEAETESLSGRYPAPVEWRWGL